MQLLTEAGSPASAAAAAAASSSASATPFKLRVIPIPGVGSTSNSTSTSTSSTLGWFFFSGVVVKADALFGMGGKSYEYATKVRHGVPIAVTA